MKDRTKNCLTCTISYRTLYEIANTVALMDATAKKMVQMHADYRRQIAELERKADSLKTTLESLGFRSSEFDSAWGRSPEEIKYAEGRTFAGMSLVDTCKQILRDFPHATFTKNKIEYLAAMGGYPFSTDDSANSVDVTMRRLAKDGFCEVHKRKGPAGNIYCLTTSRFADIVGDKLGFSKETIEKVKVAFEERSNDAASTKDARK